MPKPFKVESADINLLNDIQLTQLLKELLHAEAYKFGIIQRSVEVALNIRVGDGGEDGRISWQGGVNDTDYIPNRLTLFQNKATEMGPTAYADEIMASRTTLKSKVEEVFSLGGAYVVFTTQELNGKQKSQRISAIRKKLRDLNKYYANTCEILIYDAAQIASWTSNFISTIISVQHWIGRPDARGMKTYSLWHGHEELSRLPFVAAASRNDIISSLLSKISEPRACFRIMGLSGLGKTRTAFHIFEEKENLRNLVVYIDANHEPTLDALVADWVSLGLKAILVVDNCDYRLHERLVREIRRIDSQLSLLSLDYNLESVAAPTECFKLDPMTDEELLQLLSPIYKDRLPDLDRVVGFAQGFPQMAVLLAEARLNEDPKIGELTEDELANKLLWGHDEQGSSEDLNILQVCSLFDVFGIEREVEPQLDHIASVVGVHIDTVYECVHKFSQRGVIDRRGRFGQVVPKPLAIRLAGQWWSKTREKKQRELVDGIPESMVEGFCHQVEKLDFHTNVKKLTESLCGPQGPFGQAGVILSVRGSRLFRAFVNVNPEATCKAIYQTLTKLTPEDLNNVSGEIRRNLVWGLERLCFHADIFSEAAWCLLLLASAENEAFSNNATGIFSQLFQIHLSGTAALPQDRFNLLDKALGMRTTEVDMVVLEALKSAVSTHGRSRMVGAEYQGTKAPLEEWRPVFWQEIFDYWKKAFDLLIDLFSRGDAQKKEVLSIIGYSIRGFVSRGRIGMLDQAIKQIISINGRYWPAALDSIKDALNYDLKDGTPEVEEALNAWLELLNPDESDLQEKLKILVINPPWEHIEGDDGHYIDVAAENAKALAREVVKDIPSLLPHIDMLLQGEQKQSYVFGRQLALELQDANELLEFSLQRISDYQAANLSFVLGLYSGIFDLSAKNWQLNIDKLLEDPRLICIYPDAIRTGKIQKIHLDILLDLIQKNIISPNSANVLSYGSVTNEIEPSVMSDFSLSLASFGENASWTALNVIYMYCFGNKGVIDRIRDSIKQLVTEVPLSKGQKNTSTDTYQWHDMSKKLLVIRDEEFAIALMNQLIAACKHGLEYGDLCHYAKPLLIELMRDYHSLIWPILGDAIIAAQGLEKFWIQQLLERDMGFSKKVPSVFSEIPVNSVISWCNKVPELGPRFVAGCIDIIEREDSQRRPSDIFIALLEHFGGDDRVASALSANMSTRSWSGSLVPYLEADKKSLSPLLKHQNENVRSWIGKKLDSICKQIEEESLKDDEGDLGIY